MLILNFAFAANAQMDIYDSGGILMPEQAAYDVKFYELTLEVSPDQKVLKAFSEWKRKWCSRCIGWCLIWILLLTINGIWNMRLTGKREIAAYHRQVGKIWIDLKKTYQPGDKVAVEIAYGGKPRPAPQAPWDGGFSWAKTPSGAHWIATSCQGEGADIWWPCKDHVSDEPDSMALHIRVPDPLVVASNGSLGNIEKHNNNTSTYHWFISNPINIYNVALNIAPYRVIEDKMDCVTGEQYPVVFYVLPEDYEKGQKLFPEILDHLRFFEKFCGPYPFRADKYGVAQTPHLGMEHQSIIAYGANFNNASMTGKDWGFDALHQHELAHEWWGNLVTNSDWRDMWLHEGFGSYMQPLYVEQTQGKAVYRQYMQSMRGFSNRLAVAPRVSKTSDEIYQAPIYDKGAWVLHTLRYVMGDVAFFRALRRMAYPDPAMERITDGRQTRFATTDDFLSICETESGLNLDWFFEVYLRQSQLPKLYSKIENGKLNLRWESPVKDMPFLMPVEIEIGNKRQRIQIPAEGVTIPIGKIDKPIIDPDGWLLFEIGK
ncbi:MAG: M1 family metallopeptidase [Saprospiraceae bacterium]|nr:M1 family metallopeptidase [Saprospiraceae bacterium]